VPEIVEDGVTGFVVEDELSAVGAINNLPKLSRQGVRKHFEKRFTSRRMAEDYLQLYEKLSVQGRERPAFRPHLAAG
jgi:glycosyltransferase involved in cell wall biosynthesis